MKQLWKSQCWCVCCSIYHSAQIKWDIVNRRFISLRRIINNHFFNKLIVIHQYLVAPPSRAINAAIFLGIEE